MTKRRIALEPRRFWTADEDRILRERFPHEPTKTVAAALGRAYGGTHQRAGALGLRKSAVYLASPCAGRLGHGQGGATRFPKGHVPANKGLRRPGWGPGRMKSTQFKPGCRQGVAAKNWMPIGTINVIDGYLRIKVREALPGEAYGSGNTKAWPLMQRYVWEQAHGPVPENHVVVFKDGNTRNCDLSNLECLSRQELMQRNSIHRLPPALKQTVQLLGRVNRQIRKRERDGQEQNH
ncbi:MAG: HNH endonuclease signature motif containing protein [Vicinamibacterales bacterium]